MNDAWRVTTSLGRRLQNTPVWLWMVPAALLMLAIFYAQPAGSVQQSAIYDLFGGATVLVAGLAIARRKPAGAMPWLLMLLGQLSFVVGDALWTTYAALGDDPFPSIADAAYLVGYPLIAVGLALAIRRRISTACRAFMSPIWSAPGVWPASPCVWRACGGCRTPRRRSP